MRPSQLAASLVQPPGPPSPRRVIGDAQSDLPPGLRRDPLPLPMGNMQQARADLHKAIAALNAEQARLDAFNTAQERAMHEHHSALHTLRDAEEALKEAKTNDPVRLAYAYANRQEVITEPVQEERAAVDQAQAEVARMEAVRKALEDQAQASENRLQRLRLPLQNALAAIIIASPQYAQLYQELRQTWTRLRTLRAVLYEIESSGHVPPPHFGHWQSVEPVDERVGYPIDRDLVAKWSEALAELSANADAPLPELLDEP